MAKVWLRKLSDVRDVVREFSRLVGAESDELRGGTIGRLTRRDLDSESRDRAGIESDIVRFLWRDTSTFRSDATCVRSLDR